MLKNIENRNLKGFDSYTFDPNGFPLEPGMRLLEASAGTGKSFSIAHLVLRLVTEKKCPIEKIHLTT